MPRDDGASEEGEVGEGRAGSEGRGALGWARNWWRALVAETVATALLVGLGVASTLPFVSGQATEPAMAFGCVVAGNCVAFGAASGAHMNPAVTLAALLQGRLEWRAAGAYVAAQAGGALAGLAALWATAPAAALAGCAGCTRLAAGVSPLAGACLEAVLTGTLVLACCALWSAPSHHPAPDHAAPLLLGLLVAGLVYAGGTATGASLNPARSLAPAILNTGRVDELGVTVGAWDHHWVYWVGPLAGAALAQLLHRWVLCVPTPTKRRAHHDLPLVDKPSP